MRQDRGRAQGNEAPRGGVTRRGGRRGRGTGAGLKPEWHQCLREVDGASAGSLSDPNVLLVNYGRPQH